MLNTKYPTVLLKSSQNPHDLQELEGRTDFVPIFQLACDLYSTFVVQIYCLPFLTSSEQLLLPFCSFMETEF